MATGFRSHPILDPFQRLPISFPRAWSRAGSNGASSKENMPGFRGNHLSLLCSPSKTQRHRAIIRKGQHSHGTWLRLSDYSFYTVRAGEHILNVQLTTSVLNNYPPHQIIYHLNIGCIYLGGKKKTPECSPQSPNCKNEANDSSNTQGLD